jgi:hypothetical protein
MAEIKPDHWASNNNDTLTGDSEEGIKPVEDAGEYW